MNAPPNQRVHVMAPKDVHENLVRIVESMDRIRNECATNLGASNEQKTDYLRFAGELSGCVNAVVNENRLHQHTEVVKVLYNRDPLLRHYDPLQTEFWNEREPKLRIALDDFTAVLMGDDFIGGNQPYHIFQGVKYGNVNGNRDVVYETILPSSQLIVQALQNQELATYLLRQFLSVSAVDGFGVSGNINHLEYVKILRHLGAMYVDLSKETFQRMKKDFPKTIVVKKDGTEYTRVVFDFPELEAGKNTARDMHELAAHNFGDSESSLIRNIKNFHSFGKTFLNELKKRIGSGDKTHPERDSKKEIKKTIEQIVLIDKSSAKRSDEMSQNEWPKYWKQINDGRIMASMGDFYLSFKELKRMKVEGAEKEKKIAKGYLRSLKNNFESSWLISSTRLQYNGNNLECKIVHHFDCGDKSFVDEKEAINVPVYRGTLITEVVNNNEGLKYLQTLFNTEDDGETIIQTLEFISGKNRDEIKVWTAAIDGQFTRQSNDGRASGLNSSNGCFHVLGYDSLDFAGRSRGVVVGAEKISKGNEGRQTDKNSLNLDFGINSLERNVYASNMQTVGKLVTVSSIFYFERLRYVVSMTIPKNILDRHNDLNIEIGKILAEDGNSTNKLKKLSQQISPLYAHLSMYSKKEQKSQELKNEQYTLTDDIEFFEENVRTK